MRTERRVLSVVGTRPNFMKVAPVARRLAGRADVEHVLIHTGQHYDDAMSRVFFDELGLPAPDAYLGIGSGSHTAQIARVLKRLEPVLRERRPDVVLVPGDVNSTLAAALSAKQLGLRVGHIEAGLRSFDRTMPEELNRVLTDQISDLLFIHSPEAREHLLAEGRPSEAIHNVGNTMIDTLVDLRGAIIEREAPAAYGVEPRGYVLVTLHRPALVDGALLKRALDALCELAETYEVVFPLHPRTRARIDTLDGGVALHPRLKLIEAVGYLDFLSLAESAAGVLTDSGGVQEETTFLGVPCFTLRANTERPITVELGTNMVLGLDPERIVEIPRLLSQRSSNSRRVPEGWDGHAADRIVAVLDALAGTYGS
ncbi:MAG TPA: UDP-N-acetylglucosamine 2-epimerase (non-hydrolyzing) [Solirubrobacteraceae bacterium]|nr:UDP-N-acetylglucosamine 2-epimerase (non-hydrolyzing) [Solirubrobacteraceae bacterium]